MKPKVFQYIVLSLLLFFCTSACNDSDARENSNQPLPSTPEEGQVEEAGPFMRGRKVAYRLYAPGVSG